MRRIQKVGWCRLRAPCDRARGREYGSRLTQSSSCAATLLSWLVWRSLCDHGAFPLTRRVPAHVYGAVTGTESGPACLGKQLVRRGRPLL